MHLVIFILKNGKEYSILKGYKNIYLALKLNKRVYWTAFSKENNNLSTYLEVQVFQKKNN